jgi:hypothetical protein
MLHGNTVETPAGSGVIPTDDLRVQ